MTLVHGRGASADGILSLGLQLDRPVRLIANAP